VSVGVFRLLSLTGAFLCLHASVYLSGYLSAYLSAYLSVYCRSRVATTARSKCGISTAAPVSHYPHPSHTERETRVCVSECVGVRVVVRQKEIMAE
jgi:hypothetical protein